MSIISDCCLKQEVKAIYFTNEKNLQGTSDLSNQDHNIADLEFL